MSRVNSCVNLAILSLWVLITVPASEVAAQTRQSPASQSGTPLKDVSELQSRTQPSDPETWPGAKVYRASCASCHEGQVPKAPHKTFLQMMTAQTIHAALESGLMADQGRALGADNRRAVAEYLASAPLESGGAAAAASAPVCDGDAARFHPQRAPAAVGWGHGNARFISADVAGLDAADVPQLKLKWAFEFPGAIRARSQPAIAYGAVYAGSHDGTVYAFDLQTGCTRWTFRASAEVRTAIVLDPRGVESEARPLLYFGDVIARAYAVDARTGELVWSRKVDDHPNATITGTPSVAAGVLYVPVSSLEVTAAADPKYECCTFRGAIVALDAATGAMRWKAHTIPTAPQPLRRTSAGTRVFAPSGAPVWSSPEIDRNRGVLYVGTGENYSSPAETHSDALLAFRLHDGSPVWSQQLLAGDAWNVACMMADNPNCPAENGPDLDVAAGVILARIGARDVLLVGQKNGVVYALDPDERGRLLWKTRVGRGGIQGGVHFGMALEGSRLYVPIADLEDGHDGRTYDSPARPGLYALDATDGRYLWSAPAPDVCAGRQFCDPGISAAATAIPGVVFAGHMDGVLRAYDGASGRVVWEFDSTRAVTTVSGSRARGGSFGGGGPIIRDGHVIVSSGYGLYFHMPGNVLLVFSAESR